MPEGETGTLTVEGLLPITTGADEDLLTNVAGNDGFDSKTASVFPETFDNHYPFQDDVPDFLLYDVGDFPPISNSVNDYNAEDGAEMPTYRPPP